MVSPGAAAATAAEIVAVHPDPPPGFTQWVGGRGGAPLAVEIGACPPAPPRGFTRWAAARAGPLTPTMNAAAVAARTQSFMNPPEIDSLHWAERKTTAEGLTA